jgi:hypothetical protein
MSPHTFCRLLPLLPVTGTMAAGAARQKMAPGEAAGLLSILNKQLNQQLE